MSWFKRERENIFTPKDERMQAPDGLWVKCPSCKNPSHFKDLESNHHICPHCEHHLKIGSREYFQILFDEGKYEEFNAGLVSEDPLQFRDNKAYPDRIADAQQKTGLNDAVATAVGKLEGHNLVAAAMDFRFIGGSMGSVVGEKIARATDFALENQLPLLVIAKSGGARMMEGNLSLMQMAKTSAKLARMHEAGLPYISLLTDPTTGGVTASFAMLGDYNLAEPGALIGFAGPRVIRETIGRDLPEGFQSAEFLLDHGFVDAIVPRNQLRSRMAQILDLLDH